MPPRSCHEVFLDRPLTLVEAREIVEIHFKPIRYLLTYYLLGCRRVVRLERISSKHQLAILLRKKIFGGELLQVEMSE